MSHLLNYLRGRKLLLPRVQVWYITNKLMIHISSCLILLKIKSLSELVKEKKSSMFCPMVLVSRAVQASIKALPF